MQFFSYIALHNNSPKSLVHAIVDWNFVLPQNSYVEALTPMRVKFSYKTGALMLEILPL